MGATFLFNYGFFVLLTVFIVFTCVQNSGAFPTESGEQWTTTEESPILKKATESLNLTRPEREIDLRQNLHKHLKPLVGVNSLLKKPKPVEKAITPYFVRILKRRPGSSSKESSEDDDSTEIPKVLIDRRRNKDNPIQPVVVIDENGLPLRNRTVLVEKEETPSPKPISNELIITEIEKREPSNAVAEALQSLQDSLSAASSTTTTTIPPSNSPETSPPILTEPLVQSTPELTTPPPPPPSSSTTEETVKQITSETEHSPPSEEEPNLPPSFSLVTAPPSEYPNHSFTSGPISIPPSLVSPEVHETIEPDLTSNSDENRSIFPINGDSDDGSDLASTSTAYPTDSHSSYSTLAVTRVLPNGENNNTPTVSQQEEAMQASEILPQQFPATTPISFIANKDTTTSDTTTVLPTEAELQSPSSSSAISGDQLQQLMKAALTRLLLQGSNPTPAVTAAGNKLPEVSIPHQVRLIENKPKTEEVVVFSPAPAPAPRDLISKPTSPMPSILNALQSLISIPTTSRPTFAPSIQPKEVQSPLSSIFAFNSQDNPFSRLFSTTRASTTNYAIVRATRTTTAPPTFFINLRNSGTTELPRSIFNNEAATTRIPILATPGKTWEEFNGRQNSLSSNNNSPLRAILMMPANFMMGMFKAAQQFGEFIGNTFNNFATAFNPNRVRN